MQSFNTAMFFFLQLCIVLFTCNNCFSLLLFSLLCFSLFLVISFYYFEVFVCRLCCSLLDLSSAVSFTWDFWLSSSWSVWRVCRPQGIVLCRSRCPNSQLQLGSTFLRSWPLEDLHYLPVTKHKENQLWWSSHLVSTE